MASKYEYMTKEEILKELAESRKKTSSYKWRKSLTLTPKEGEVLENDILPQYGCENPSQLIKKIVKGELILSFPEND